MSKLRFDSCVAKTDAEGSTVPSAVVRASGRKGSPFEGISPADPETLAPSPAGSRPQRRVEKTSGDQTTSVGGSRAGTRKVVQLGDQEDPIVRYEALFRLHYAAILSFCLKRLEDASDAEDAVQETFLRALSHPPLLAEPLPWLIRVATHLCVDQLRRRRRAELLLAALEGQADRWLDHKVTDCPSDSADVDDLLRILTEAERRVITRTLLSDESHGEVATQLGITCSTSRVLRSRALRKLRLAASAAVAQ
jgi:RNA polymerase sigma-70 factor, ECF subfamily